MARIRTIKPDFFTSADVVGLSPLARLLYIATWLEADRAGRLPWRIKTLKLRYLPGDDCDIEALSTELVDAGLVVPYEVDGERFAEIPSFTRHQIINNRETPSAIPARVPHASPTRAPRVTHATGTPLVGREGKGKEGREDASMTRAPSPKARASAPRKSKTLIPADFSITDRVRTWAGEHGFPDLDQHLEAFKAKCAAKAYTYADWDSAFMEAIRADWAKLRSVGGASVAGAAQAWAGAH